LRIAFTEKYLCPANTPTPAQFYLQAPNSTELAGGVQRRAGEAGAVSSFTGFGRGWGFPYKAGIHPGNGARTSGQPDARCSASYTWATDRCY